MSVPAWLRRRGRTSSPPEPFASADRATHAGRSAFALRRALPALLLLPVLLAGLLSGAGSVEAAGTLPTVSVSDARVSEDGTWMSFKVSLSQPSSEQVTVRFATSGGTATSGTDFRAVSRTLTIYPNETMLYESVLVYDDQARELDETFTVTLTNPTGAALGDATATGTIVDDGDTARRLTASDIEDTTATLTISGHTGGWWYRDRDTATSRWGACTAVSAGTTAVSISGLTAVTTYDYRAYSDSACSKKLANVEFRTIAPKGAPTVSVSDAKVSEDGTWMTFEVSLSHASREEVTVEIRTSGGTATPRTYTPSYVVGDYRDASETRTFAVNSETWLHFNVLVYDDQVPEPDETFTVTLTNPKGATLGDATATGTIVDDGDTAARLTASDIEDTTATLTISGHTGSWWYRDRDTANSRWGACTAVSAGTTAVSISGLTAVTTYDYRAYSDSACSKKLARVEFRTIAPKGTPTVSVVSAAQVSEDRTWMTFEVSLSHASREEVTVEIRTSGGTATSGTDFRAVSRTRTFAANSATWLHFNVLVYDDQEPEPDETFTVTLTNPKGATLGDATATGTIKDDDGYTAATVSFATDTQILSEDFGKVYVEVKLGKAAPSDLTFAYTVDGTATAGSDFTIADSGTLSVPAGATTAFIPVTIIDDSLPESNETVVLTLAGSGGYEVVSPGTHTLTIGENEPQVSFASASQSVGEGSGTHNVGVRLNGWAATDTTFTYTVGGTATAGSDFTIADSGTVTMLAGGSSAAIPVTLIDDSVEDSGETVVLTLTAGNGYAVGAIDTHTLTIQNYELLDGTVVTIAAGTSPVTEGGDATFTITANPAPASPLAVWVTLAAQGDYGVTTAGGVTVGSRTLVGTVSIPTTGSVTLTLATAGDDADEPDGSVTMTVMNREGYAVGASASGTVAIQDDDEASVSFASASQSAGEGSGTHNVEVRLSPAPATDTTFTYTVDGTATAGSDFTIANSGTLSVPKGATTATIPVAIIDDSVEDGGETVVLTLTAGNGYVVGTIATHTLTIENDEPPDEPAVTIAASASPVTEGGDAEFTLTATPAPTADLPVSVTVATDGDYGVTPGTRTVTIPTTGSATLTLTTSGDEADEADGSVTVTVTGGDGYTVGSSASGSVTVHDDDAAPGAPDWTDFQTVVNRIIEARDNPTNAWARGGGNAAHVAKWNRVLEAIGYDTGTGVSPMAASEIHANAAKWPQSTFKAASVYLKSQEQDPDEPAVTVTAGEAVTEGGSATFTLTATPAPAADLAVSVTVASDGDWGVTAGTRTVTIDTTGSAVLTLATTGDDADEADGSVSVTVTDAAGYTVGDPASGSVAVRDDDEPPPDTPVVTVTAGDAVTEGASATFTLTATPAPAAPLSVSVTVAASGDYGVTAGPQTVSIPTTGTAVLTLSTAGDDADEPDGSVSVTVEDGTGYTVGDPASGSVAVRDDDEPVVTVSAGDAVTEGDSASFTLTASPVPAAALAVRVTIATAGEYGISAGSRTVSIPTTGSTTLSLPTTDDATDEPDGSVTATVEGGAGYTAGNPASGTVALLDDDLPPPVVTIAAQASPVTEGGDAAFTLTADRAPAAALTVKLSVSETGTGDHVAAADEGPASVVIAKGETEAVFRVATVNDAVDEPDTSAVVTVEAGAGYTVGTPSSGTVTVVDDDTTSLPALSVADETAREGVDWMLTFTVRLSAPAPEAVEVRVDTRPSTPVSAEPGQDYLPAPVGGHRVVFGAGETQRPVQVIVLDDSHDEEAETFELVLSDAKGANIADGVAVGTITNDDPMPAAWLARFGRTVAEQALDGIAGRMSAPRTPGMQGALAGLPLDFDAPAGGAPGAWSGAGAGDAAAGSPALAGTGARALADVAQAFGEDSDRSGMGGIGDGFGHDPAVFGNGIGAPALPHVHTLTAREALLGSRFTLTGEADASGGTAALWGRASQARFDGREGTFSLDGEATTALLGADYARGKWLIGLALAQSAGEGDYRDTKAMPRPPSQTCPAGAGPLCDEAVRAGDGRVEASLTAALPYASVQASERLKLWGAVGYGTGEVTLATALGGRYTADTTWRMAAAGLRGALLEAPAQASGPALALTSDALWTRTSSERTRDLAASDSGVTRLRLGLEGSWRFALDGGGSLTPKLELGARRDGGDAETGFGVELGGGVAWSDPALGLSLDVSGRTLLAHGDDDLEDRGVAASLAWDPRPATQRGLSLALRQDWGGQAGGGLDALFAPEPLGDRIGSGSGGEATSRWTMEAAYGLPAFGGRFTGSPHAGLGLSGAARDYSLGWRWTPEAASAPDLAFGLKATRRESDTAEPEHTLGVEVRAAW